MNLKQATFKKQVRVSNKVETIVNLVSRVVDSHWAHLQTELAARPTVSQLTTLFRNFFPDISTELEELFAEFVDWLQLETEWVLKADDSLYLIFLEGRKEDFIKSIAIQPTKDEALEIIYSTNASDNVSWKSRLEKLSHKITNKDKLAKTLAFQYANGATTEEIAEKIKPFVNNIQSSATRIARTEGHRIANEMNERYMDALGSSVKGYQIHGVLDTKIRPEHFRRHGTIYGKNQKRPSLPDEPNCRCWYTPVIGTKAEIAALKAKSKNLESPQAKKLGKWFDTATPSQKTKVIGKRDYNKLLASKKQKKKKQVVTWNDFVSYRKSVKKKQPKSVPKKEPSTPSRNKSGRNKVREKSQRNLRKN